jgi:hypothetical protein
LRTSRFSVADWVAYSGLSILSQVGESSLSLEDCLTRRSSLLSRPPLRVESPGVVCTGEGSPTSRISACGSWAPCLPALDTFDRPMAITSIGRRCLYCEEDRKIKKWSAYAWLALARWTRWVYMSKRVHDHRSDSVEDLLPATPGISTLMIQKNLILCRYRMAVYVISQRGILASTAILMQYVGRNVGVDAVVRKINVRAD